MDLNSISNAFKSWVDGIVHSDWLSTLITMVLIIIVTAICAHLVTLFLRKLFKMNKSLPAVSIFINIGRVTVWVIGICVILSSCFNVNVGAAVTALGIGGIAISLGFQATLSNLIGGLQIIMTKLIEPGERIKVGSNEGTVVDVTWRHTTIHTDNGDMVIIPNSVINTSALEKVSTSEKAKNASKATVQAAKDAYEKEHGESAQPLKVNLGDAKADKSAKAEEAQTAASEKDDHDKSGK